MTPSPAATTIIAQVKPRVRRCPSVRSAVVVIPVPRSADPSTRNPQSSPELVLGARVRPVRAQPKCHRLNYGFGLSGHHAVGLLGAMPPASNLALSHWSFLGSRGKR